MRRITPASLAAMLKLAAEAHHAYEQSTGKPDPDWPLWYATWIMDRVDLSATVNRDGSLAPPLTMADVPSAEKGYL